MVKLRKRGEEEEEPILPQPKKQKQAPLEIFTSQLRKACDNCVAQKRGCEGGNPCLNCERKELECHYSLKKKSGPRSAGLDVQQPSPPLPVASRDKEGVKDKREAKEKKVVKPKIDKSVSSVSDTTDFTEESDTSTDRRWKRSSRSSSPVATVRAPTPPKPPLIEKPKVEALPKQSKLSKALIKKAEPAKERIKDVKDTKGILGNAPFSGCRTQDSPQKNTGKMPPPPPLPSLRSDSLQSTGAMAVFDLSSQNSCSSCNGVVNDNVSTTSWNSGGGGGITRQSSLLNAMERLDSDAAKSVDNYDDF